MADWGIGTDAKRFTVVTMTGLNEVRSWPKEVGLWVFFQSFQSVSSWALIPVSTATFSISSSPNP